MREFNVAGAALFARQLAGERIPVITLVYLGTPVPQYWAVGGTPLVWDGHDWEAKDIDISEIVDSVTGLNDLTFTLPGVSPSEIAFAFDDTDDVAVVLYDAWVDPDTGVVVDALQAWAGERDTPGWQDGPEATVIFKAIHRGKAALRGHASKYTDDEQQRLYPGDTSLMFNPATDAAGRIWPGAGFFKQ